MANEKDKTERMADIVLGVMFVLFLVCIVAGIWALLGWEIGLIALGVVGVAYTFIMLVENDKNRKP